MKRLLYLIISLCLVLLVHCATEQKTTLPAARSQEKCDAPIWKVGDSWKFMKSTKRWFENKVVRIEKWKGVDLYVVENPLDIYMRGFDKNSLESKVSIDSTGKKIPVEGSDIYYEFPLYVGKKWKRMTTSYSVNRDIKWNYLHEYRVISYEDVSVLAGTFKAFKIKYKQTNMGRSEHAFWEAYIWFSPEVKREVKVLYEGPWKDRQDYELTSYKLPAPQKLIEDYRTQATQHMELMSPPSGVDIFPMPQLIEGDTWVRQSEKGKFIWEIERIGDSGMILKQGENEYYYDNEFGEIKGISSGKTVYEFTPPYKGWHSYPLWVGKKWQNNFKEKNLEKGYIYAFNELVEVKDLENVETTAGIFKAMKIDITRVNLDTGGRWTYTVWYSPDVKAPIKSLSKDLPARNWTLAEFRLAKVEPPTKAPPVEKPFPPKLDVTPRSANTVVVTGTSANIRSGAGNEFSVVTTLKHGDKLILLGEHGEWFNVRSESGQEGWINNKFVK